MTQKTKQSNLSRRLYSVIMRDRYLECGTRVLKDNVKNSEVLLYLSEEN